MCAICDVNEYRKCVKEFKIPLVNTLFDTLHALCNLLLVKTENLKQVCTGDQLVGTKKISIKLKLQKQILTIIKLMPILSFGLILAKNN